jgi:hypothetical protein
VAVYDTAWEMPVFATLAEADQYFAHLNQAGFTGAWLSYFNHINGGMGGTNVNGDPVATGGYGDRFYLNDGYINHMRGILDAASRNGQKVGFVMIWANKYANDGSLNTGNSWQLGYDIGQAFGDHPAIVHWVAGGDNFSGIEDPQIWANMVSGLREAGANQQVGYHSPAYGGSNGHLRFVNEWWVDFIAPQTGHCQNAATTYGQLADVVNQTGKPVYAGELRYEDISPSWCNSPDGEGVPGWAVEADTQAAVDAGVDAIIYGHNERWQWGKALNGGSGGGGGAAIASLGSDGESRTIAVASRY